MSAPDVWVSKLTTAQRVESIEQAIAAAGLKQIRYLNHGDTYNFEVSATQG